LDIWMDDWPSLRRVNQDGRKVCDVLYIPMLLVDLGLID